MKIGLLTMLGVVVVALAAYYFLFPSNKFITFYRPGGGSIAFSRTRVWLEAPPDLYSANGFAHIESYVTRLLTPSRHRKSVGIFAAAGDRGFGLHNEDGNIDATLTVEWRQEPPREAAIRSFFASLDVAPSQDYLAGNGGVPDATRILWYRLPSNGPEVTALTKRILTELCGISASEPLVIKYTDGLP